MPLLPLLPPSLLHTFSDPTVYTPFTLCARSGACCGFPGHFLGLCLCACFILLSRCLCSCPAACLCSSPLCRLSSSVYGLRLWCREIYHLASGALVRAVNRQKERPPIFVLGGLSSLCYCLVNRQICRTRSPRPPGCSPVLRCWSGPIT